MRIGLLSGSFSPDSSNQAALDVIAARADDVAEITTERIEGLLSIPAFVAEEVDSPPEAVVRFRAQIALADAVVVAIPEYAAGLAGSTKNALDWLVGASTLYKKPVAVISAGTTGGYRTIDELAQLLKHLFAATHGTSSERRAALKNVVGHFAIDIERFGDID